jgi:hypothetical protein
MRRDLVSADFFMVPTVFFRVLFVFVILSQASAGIDAVGSLASLAWGPKGRHYKSVFACVGVEECTIFSSYGQCSVRIAGDVPRMRTAPKTFYCNDL